MIPFRACFVPFAFAALAAGSAGVSLRANFETIYVGTYTDTSSRGIYAVQFDSSSGQLSAPSLAATIPSPSFLAFSPDRRRLYAVQESGAGGKVNAFSVDPESSQLTFINSRTTDGKSTAHLAVDPTGRMVIAANYGSGSICAFPIGSDGGLGEHTSFVEQHGPLGPNKLRQKAAHPHSVTFSPDGAFAFVCDLGSDQVFIYRVDAVQGTIALSDPASAAVPPGSGPRHSVFSADSRFLYVVSEMGGSVCVFGWDPAQRSLTLKQTLSTLPAGFSGFNGSAEIAIGRSGKYLYASNRGPNSLAVFARDRADGTLKLVEIDPCGGDQPRNFALSPDGHWLICANQKSDQLVVFRIEAGSGKLLPTGHTAAIAHPTCIVFRAFR